MLGRLDPVLRGGLEQAFHEIYDGGSDPMLVFEELLDRYVTAIAPAGLGWTSHLTDRHICLFKHFLQYGDDWFPYASHIQGKPGLDLLRISALPPDFISENLWKELIKNRHQFIEQSRRLERNVSMPLRTILQPLSEKMRETPYHGHGRKDIDGAVAADCWIQLIKSGQVHRFKREVDTTVELLRRNIESLADISKRVEAGLSVARKNQPVASSIASSALENIGSQNDMALWFLGYLAEAFQIASESPVPSATQLEQIAMPRLIAATYLPWLELFPETKSHEIKLSVSIEGLDTIASAVVSKSQAHRYAAWLAFSEIHEEVFKPLMRILDRFESRRILLKEKAIDDLKDEIKNSEIRAKFFLKGRRIERMFNHFKTYQPYLAESDQHTSEWHKLWNSCALFITFISEFDKALGNLLSWSSDTEWSEIFDGVSQIKRNYLSFFRKQSTSPLHGNGREPSPVDFVAKMYDYERDDGTSITAKHLGELPEEIDTRMLTHLLLDLVEGLIRVSRPDRPHRIGIVADTNSVMVTDTSGSTRLSSIRTDLLSKLHHSSGLTKMEIKYNRNMGCTYVIRFPTTTARLGPLR